MSYIQPTGPLSLVAAVEGGSAQALIASGTTGPSRGAAAAGGLVPNRRKEERIPQWSYHETREFIAIRAELEKDFMLLKRNKGLWEVVSTKMKEKGFRRSPEQCRCKWKNLVNRYKCCSRIAFTEVLLQGKETDIMDPAEAGRQCAFYDELDAIFKQRDKLASQLAVEGGEQAQRRMMSGNGAIVVGSEEESEDDTEEEVDTEEERKRRKKKRKRMTIENSKALVMQEVLADFFHQQQRMEETWRQDVERREQARRLKEEEWREAMQRLEEERLGREREWREREEMRRAQEDARAEKRDQLFAALIAKLTQGS